METLTKRVGWVSLGRLAGTVSLLLINVFLARYLSKFELGSYQKIWMLVNICIPLFLFGLPLGISYFLPRLEEHERSRSLWQQVALIGIMAAAFCVGLLVFAPQAAVLLGGEHLVPLIRLAAFIGAGLIASGFWEPFLIVYGRHRWLAISLSIYALFYLAAVLVGRLVGESLYWIFACLCGFALFRVSACFFVLLRLARPFSLRWRRDWLRCQLAYALPIGLRDGVGVLARFTDKLIANFHATTDQFAYYYVGAWELPVVGLVVDSMQGVLMPDFAAAHHRGENFRIVELMRLAARRIGLLVFPLGALSFVAAPEIMALLYGEAFRSSGGYFRIFSLILPCRISTGGVVLLAAGRPNVVLLGAVMDVVMAGALGLALVSWFGLRGAAAALVFSTFCQVLFLLWQVSRTVGTPLRHLLPWRELLRLLGFSAAVAGVASLAGVFPRPVLNLFAISLLFGGLFLGAGVYGRGLAAEERTMVRRYLAAGVEFLRRRGSA